ncbi:unnamed protein product [Coregonus sp. 'balchen']|nr:unnamed protein product [Coregonus sp. 'balchen']
MITINGQEYHLQLVDTAGQDEYSIFPQTYSIDINGYILVYSGDPGFWEGALATPGTLPFPGIPQFKRNQTAVEVFKRMILEAEKLEGGVQPGKTSCSVM